MVDAAKRFEQTLHVIFQESLDGTVEVEDVFLVGETMAFVVFHHVFHFHAASSESRHHLVAFVLVDARIVGPLCDEERATNGVGMQGRRRGFELRAVAIGVADLFVHHVEHCAPVRRNGLQESEQIGHAHVVDGTAIKLRCEASSRQGGISTVGGTVNGYAFRVGYA